MPTFADSVPSQFGPISDSDWNKLDDAGRAEYLRKREQIMLARHRELREGMGAIQSKVSSQGVTIKMQAAEVGKISKRQDEQGSLLEANTAATARTEAKVDELVLDSKALLGFWKDAAATGRMVGLAKALTIKLAWIAAPAGVAYGAWSAFKGWLHTKGM